jgi:DNA-binding CsgD family transcriptional regulator
MALKRRIKDSDLIKLVDMGLSKTEMARILNVSRPTLYKALRRLPDAFTGLKTPGDRNKPKFVVSQTDEKIALIIIRLRLEQKRTWEHIAKNMGVSQRTVLRYRRMIEERTGLIIP